MTLPCLILDLLTAAAALLLGLGGLFDARVARAALPALPQGRGARWAFCGVVLLGGALMLAAAAKPFFAFFAAVLITLSVLGALLGLLRRPVRQGGASAVALLLASVAVGLWQPLGLRVLALPRAEALPYQQVAGARVLKTYPEGMWFESVKVGPDGTIYLSANRGEDWLTGDKRAVVAQVLARSPDGRERVFFQLPPATTSGVLAFGADGALYLTSDGAARGVWRLAPDGQGTLIAKLPEGAWPNGLCAGPDGKLYVADARRGAIWRVDPAQGTAEVARDDRALKARAFVALAPAANGLHFAGRELLVTVSDRAQVLKLHLAEDGVLGAPTVLASGVPGDDFAIDADGALYVTTHPYDTLVRILPSGERTIVADARQQVIGATDAAFGVLPGDRRTLYLVTDGGAFSSGSPRAAGTLVALTLASNP